MTQLLTAAQPTTRGRDTEHQRQETETALARKQLK